MARQVYFDPFGMRTEGERAGVRDEAFLQDQTRRARASDFDFNELLPLRLNEAQRADRLGAAQLPYQIDALGLNQRTAINNLYNQTASILGDIGPRTGNYRPAQANDLSYLYGGYGVGLTPEQLQAQQLYYGQQTLPGFTPDQIPLMQQNLAQQYGVPMETFANPMLDPNLLPPQANQNYADYYLRPQAQQYNQAYMDYLKILADQERNRNSEAWRLLEQQRRAQAAGGGAVGTPGFNPVDIVP